MHLINCLSLTIEHRIIYKISNYYGRFCAIPSSFS
nr:MAG TPA: hypothetical protein [Herelleviridae sp. ctsMP6]